MEAVYFKVHQRLVTASCRILSPKIRKLMEVVSISSAFLFLFLLLWLHKSYVNLNGSQCNCLKRSLVSMDGNVSFIENFDMLRVSVVSSPKGYYDTNVVKNGCWIPQSDFSWNNSSGIESFLWNSLLVIDSGIFLSYEKPLSNLIRLSRFLLSSIISLPTRLYSDFSKQLTFSTTKSHSNRNVDSFVDEIQTLFDMPTVYTYSVDKKLLIDIGRSNYTGSEYESKRILDIQIPRHVSCFGPQILVTTLQTFVTYDTVLINWMASTFGGQGYLMNTHSGEIFNLDLLKEFTTLTNGKKTELDFQRCWSMKPDIWTFISRLLEKFYQRFMFKCYVLVSTVFLFFTTSTIVSFTLRETQERMLKFTHLLQYHITRRLSYATLVFTHVVETLVFVPIMIGILFFLFEFFHDQVYSFMIVSLAWTTEVYAVLSLRTRSSIRYFPRFALIYFSLLNIYVLSVPHGFTYVAIFTDVLFILHAMIHFYNNYEIPAVLCGEVHEGQPRASIDGVIPMYVPNVAATASPAMAMANSVSITLPGSGMAPSIGVYNHTQTSNAINQVTIDGNQSGMSLSREILSTRGDEAPTGSIPGSNPNDREVDSIDHAENDQFFRTFSDDDYGNEVQAEMIYGRVDSSISDIATDTLSDGTVPTHAMHSYRSIANRRMSDSARLEYLLLSQRHDVVNNVQNRARSRTDSYHSINSVSSAGENDRPLVRGYSYEDLSGFDMTSL